MTSTHPSSHVDVLLTGCDAQDADAVFHALEAVFPHVEPTARMSAGPSSGRSSHPTVWSMSVDMHTHHTGAGPAALSGAVDAGVSGCPHDVHEVQDALAEAFAVESRGAVSGDQELEVRLRLTTLAHA
ncbi:coenzyme F420-reducing hydrogenase gamma subunit [Streptacidiphilus sp. MAP12-16]|uniref:hypothetical protein n=1 Tax=Streptacidiphilus sp. MAP12-16 TaxID=3156300 RepID=UPI0035178C66